MTRRSIVAIATIAATFALGLAGCASSTGATPASSRPDATTPAPSTDPVAVWIDGGRAIALVTWGSSSTACFPRAGDVTGEGQSVAVTFAEPAPDAVCTTDFVPRATYIAAPQGVDPAKDASLTFDGGTLHGKVALAASAASAGTTPDDHTPSASWFAADGLVLLTWGSSTCPPVVAGLDESANGATVTFTADAGQACTMDVAPRLTVLQTTRPQGAADFTLTLRGDNLDGTVTVRR